MSAEQMDPAHEAAALWGIADNPAFSERERLSAALKALEHFGADAMAEEPEEERTLGTPEDAVALVRDLAENLDTLLSGYEPEDWRDAVRVLHSLRRGIERLKVVDANLVRWLYLHGEHGQHQSLDGVGPFSITRGRAKERWDVQGAAREYVETMIRRNDGEMPDPLQVLSWVLEVVSSSACRKTPIRALGLDVEDFYSSEPGTIQVGLPR